MKTLELSNPFMEGPVVTKLQRLLRKKGFSCPLNGIFEPHTAYACVQAKKKLRYPKAKQLPIAGPTLFSKLKKLPDKKPKIKRSPKRAKILEYALWGVTNEPQIHYAQVRPMDHLDDLKHLPISNDCSEFATKAYKYAGAPDPNGANYNGSGYTGTMLTHGKPVMLSQAKSGDLIIFGAWPGHHVVILEEDGAANKGNPMVISHGQEAGPIRLRLHDEEHYQPHVVTAINYLGDL